MSLSTSFTPLQAVLIDTVQMKTSANIDPKSTQGGTRRMPDALQILREDHRKVKDIFRQFEDTEDQQTKKQLVDQALTELTVHAKLEEEIFYPAVRREGGIGELIDEAEEEHHVAEMLIDELRGMRPTDERYDAKFNVLSDSVKMHIDEADANTLPKAAELGPEALRRIGQQMEQRRPALMRPA